MAPLATRAVLFQVNGARSAQLGASWRLKDTRLALGWLVDARQHLWRAKHQAPRGSTGGRRVAAAAWGLCGLRAVGCGWAAGCGLWAGCCGWQCAVEEAACLPQLRSGGEEQEDVALRHGTRTASAQLGAQHTRHMRRMRHTRHMRHTRRRRPRQRRRWWRRTPPRLSFFDLPSSMSSGAPTPASNSLLLSGSDLKRLPPLPSIRHRSCQALTLSLFSAFVLPVSLIGSTDP